MFKPSSLSDHVSFNGINVEIGYQRFSTQGYYTLYSRFIFHNRLRLQKLHFPTGFSRSSRVTYIQPLHANRRRTCKPFDYPPPPTTHTTQPELIVYMYLKSSFESMFHRWFTLTITLYSQEWILYGIRAIFMKFTCTNHRTCGVTVGNRILNIMLDNLLSVFNKFTSALPQNIS